MTDRNAWLDAALNGPDDLAPQPAPGAPAVARASGALAAPYLMVPIRALAPSSRERITAHLLALEPQDRYLRFGYPATDAQIRRYAEQLDFERDDIYGIHNRHLDIIAMAHLAYVPLPEHPHSAEFGVSVSSSARGRGYGARLFDRAIMHARNAGVGMLYIHALTENQPMLKIARNAGARVHSEGGESEAYLALPPASLDTRLAELVEQQYAEVDYQIKRQSQQWEQFMGQVRAMGEGVRRALSLSEER